MRLGDYLERIGWSGAIAPTVDTLGALLRAHNHNVPFENLDCLASQSLPSFPSALSLAKATLAKILEG